MRIAVGLLACLAVGSATLALAGDPPAPPAAAPVNATTPAATPAPAATAAPPAAAAKAAPAATPAPTVDPEVQRLLAQGYRQRMRHGQMLYCRSEPVMGSRVEKVERCGTVDELKLSAQSSRDVTEQAQRTQLNPSGH